ncbi:MAG: LysR family transcriptional regulator [Alphaproteobacteria bacterium]|jgi:fluoroacetyl-CoA thioesterase|nr:LysR family transcriptional regulator [Alphaproteobacteria bacterium]MBT4019132.1 LysR family transcriptional regulator [Alphaproteobacteria bacterium]MBT5158990.1 LysR family transcriptional regulator [Alphaproteobacteria bacterium]MBT5919591.1 LysR family transcriptional regulator [Alphaproteobacteria bacterium]MBT6387700.1 LysR family transcriptional regulator [Alphaproteobacteria bacterium]
MKDSLVAGLSVTRNFTVDKARTIDFMGEDLRIYATPELIRDIEQTCRDLLVEHCDEGEDSVGTHVSVAHTAATPMGMDVDITATVAKVEGRLVTLEVTASDNIEECGKGKHTRFVVDMAKTGERLAAKVAKANL